MNRERDHLRPGYFSVPNASHTLRDVKGLKVNIWEFTANPPTKHWGIPAPKKT